MGASFKATSNRVSFFSSRLSGDLNSFFVVSLCTSSFRRVLNSETPPPRLRSAETKKNPRRARRPQLVDTKKKDRGARHSASDVTRPTRGRPNLRRRGRRTVWVRWKCFPFPKSPFILGGKLNYETESGHCLFLCNQNSEMRTAPCRAPWARMSSLNL